jgi:hypothetical protein
MSTHRSANSPSVIHRILRRPSYINKSATNLHCCVSESKSESEMSYSSPSSPIALARLHPIDSNTNLELELELGARQPLADIIQTCYLVPDNANVPRRGAALRRWNARTRTRHNGRCQDWCRNRVDDECLMSASHVSKLR